MIKIVMEGKCKGCRCGDLKLLEISSTFSGLGFEIYCTHENACNRMEAKLNETISALINEKES